MSAPLLSRGSRLPLEEPPTISLYIGESLERGPVPSRPPNKCRKAAQTRISDCRPESFELNASQDRLCEELRVRMTKSDLYREAYKQPKQKLFMTHPQVIFLKSGRRFGVSFLYL